MVDVFTVMPECYGDTIWARLILKQSYNLKWLHIKGCNEVGKRFNENRYKNRLLIGIVDDDKLKDHSLKDFTFEILNGDSISVLRKPDTDHYYVIVKPAIETWLLKCAEYSKIRHNYDLKSLKKSMKTDAASSDTRLLSFLNTIYQKNSPQVEEMSKHLHDLLKTAR